MKEIARPSFAQLTAMPAVRRGSQAEIAGDRAGAAGGRRGGKSRRVCCASQLRHPSDRASGSGGAQLPDSRRGGCGRDAPQRPEGAVEVLACDGVGAALRRRARRRGGAAAGEQDGDARAATDAMGAKQARISLLHGQKATGGRAAQPPGLSCPRSPAITLGRVRRRVVRRPAQPGSGGGDLRARPPSTAVAHVGLAEGRRVGGR